MDRMKVPARKRKLLARALFAGALCMTTMLFSTCSNTVDLRGELETVVKESNGRYLLVKSITYPLSDGFLNPTSTVEITFDRPIDLSTLTGAPFTVLANGLTPITYDESGITYNEASNTVRFRCLPFFPVNSDILLTVSDIKGRDGSILSGAKTAAFSTADTYACSVTSLTGHDATSGAGFTKTKSIDFKIEPSDTFRYFKFKISRNGGSTWSDWITTFIDQQSLTNNSYILTNFDLDTLYAPTAAPEGPINLRFQFWGDEDGSGIPTEGLTQDIAITYDATAPDAPSVPDLAAADDTGSSNSDNLTNATSALTFSGTGEANATVLLYDGATEIGSGTTNASGAWALDATLAAGSHSLSAKTRDTAGNTGPASAALALTIDTIAPTAPSTPDLAAADDSGSSTTDNITKNTTGLSLSGTAEANSTILIFGGTSQIGSAAVNGSGNWSFEAALAVGTHSLSVKARDAAGNVGGTSTALALTIDTSVAAPSTPDLAAADDSGKSTTDNITNKTDGVTFSGTTETGATVYLYKGTTLLGSDASAAGVWTLDVTLAAGVNSLTAKATDVAGNTSVASAALAVTVDITAPAAPTFTSGTATANRTPTWVWTSGGGGGGYRYKFPTGSWTSTATGSYTAVTPLADGDYSLSATELDIAGNESAAASRTIAVNGVPNAPVITIASIISIVNTPTWNWTSGGFGGGNYRRQLNSTSDAGWVPSTLLSFTPATALADGTHTLYLAERDAVGEWSVTASKAIIVTNHSPITGTTGTYRQPTLYIRAVAGATRYDWYFSLSSQTPVLRSSGATLNSPTPTMLAANTSYKWYVNAYNASGTLLTRLPASGPVYNFVTGN